MDFTVSELRARDNYKLLAAVVVPRPIALVTSISPLGIVNAAPFSYFNMLGSEPPILGFNVGDRSANVVKDTLANIESSQSFVVHLVDEAMAEKMNICAIDFPAEESEIAAAGLRTRPARFASAPIIDDAPVHIECVLDHVLHIGNNHVVIGRVVAYGIKDEVVDRQSLRIDTPALKLIGRMHGSGWYARTSDLFNIERITYAQWIEGE